MPDDTTTTPEPDDRIELVLGVVRQLDAEHDRPITVHDYIHFRKTRTADRGELPAITTVYRIFKGWKQVLILAGVHTEGEQHKRISEQEMIDAMGAAATSLGTSVLSSHAYDEFRERNGAQMPSSSVIRKRLGPWEQAVQRAGLEAPTRGTAPRLTPETCLRSLEYAARSISGPLTEEAYEHFVTEQAQAGLPRSAQIVGVFSSWEAAVASADIDRSDDLHPETLWTVDEARRMLRTAARMLGDELSPESYEQLRAHARRPMPSWPTVAQLLDGELETVLERETTSVGPAQRFWR